MDCSTKTLFDCFSGINLTDDQKTAVDKLQLFFDDPDKKLFLLTGYAGTGKTTLLKGLYEYAASLQKSIHIMAPTGKAAHIIRTKAQCPAATIHSRIYEINLNPEARLESAGDEDGIPDVIQIARLAEGIPENLEAVYIVDESSMIGDNDADSYTDRRSKARHRESRIRFGSGRLLADLMKFCCVDKPQFSGKIIFIGDKAQLPPVFASSSPAFDKFYLKSEYNLDADSFGLEQVVRQDSRSGILSNAESIRRAIDSRTFNRLKIETAADVELISHDEVLAKFVEGWRMKPVKPVAIIAAKNDAVAEYNKLVRDHFFKGADKVQVKDLLLVYRSCLQNGEFFFNGEMLSVKEVGERRTHLVFFNRKDPDTHETETVRVELRFIALKLVSKEGGSHSGMDFTWVLEDYLDAPRPEISADAQKALMLDFINRHPGFKKLPKEEQAALMAKDQFLNCLFAKYGYAMTCHKAQGSEWPNVVVDASPINSADNESYFRWLYTAITRAKEKLFIVHAPTLTGFILKPIKCDTAPNELKLDASQNREAHESKASRAPFCDGCANGDKYSIIHNIVENALQGSGLAIEDLVKHSEYHYTCTVSSSDRIHGARISIFWSAKKQGISSVLAQPENEFSKGVADRISQKIKTPSFSNILSSSSKPEEFILDLHRRLVDAGKKTGVEFSNPKCSSYKIDFECRTIEGSALLIVYYDAKHSFTKVDVQKASPDAEQRIHQTLSLLRSSS